MNCIAAIVYDKGASIVRMIYFILGEDVWQEALRDFIQTYQFSNADYRMLFDKFNVVGFKCKLVTRVTSSNSEKLGNT